MHISSSLSGVIVKIVYGDSIDLLPEPLLTREHKSNVEGTVHNTDRRTL